MSGVELGTVVFSGSRIVAGEVAAVAGVTILGAVVVGTVAVTTVGLITRLARATCALYALIIVMSWALSVIGVAHAIELIFFSVVI